MNKGSKLHLTIQLDGARLLDAAKYSDAVIVVEGRYSPDEVVKLIKPSIEEKPRKEEVSTKTLILGHEFLDTVANEAPDSYRALKKKDNKGWKKLPFKVRLKIHCMDLALALNGSIVEYEIID